MTRTLQTTLITFLAFAVHFIIDTLYFKEIRTSLNAIIGQLGISHILAYTLVGIPIFIGVLLIRNKKHSWDSLGLNRPILQGLLVSLITVMPMLIGFAFIFEFNREITLNTLLISIVAAGFFEELYFRAFLFGQLFRYTRAGFFLAVFLGALLFGFVHLYQSTVMAELIGIFMITFIGGILFAWLYVEWQYNWRVPIFLHMFMNLSWELFSVSDNALGDVYANVFRLLTITTVILLSIWYKKKRHLKRIVSINNLLIKAEVLNESER